MISCHDAPSISYFDFPFFLWGSLLGNRFYQVGFPSLLRHSGGVLQRITSDRRRMDARMGSILVSRFDFSKTLPLVCGVSCPLVQLLSILPDFLKHFLFKVFCGFDCLEHAAILALVSLLFLSASTSPFFPPSVPCKVPQVVEGRSVWWVSRETTFFSHFPGPQAVVFRVPFCSAG